MLKTKRPPRGSFDYLLDPIKDEVPHAPPPTPPPTEPPGRRQRVMVNIEIVERRQPPAVSRGVSAFWWIVLAVLLLSFV